MKKYLSIRKKLIIGILIASIFFLLIYLFYIFILYKNILKYEEEKIKIYNKSVSANININLQEVIVQLKNFTDLNEFKVFNINQISRLVSFYSNHNALIDNIYVCDEQGNIRIASIKNTSIPIEGNVSSFDLFKQAIEDKNLIISDNYIDDKLFISISIPIISLNYRVIGALIVFLNLKNRDITIFNNLVDPDSYQWEVILTNKKGILLYHSHRDIENFNFSDYPSVRNALLGKYGLNEVKINNKYYYSSSEFIPLCEWLVIVQVPRKLIIDKVFRIITPNLALLFTLFIIAVGAVMFFINMLINPIVKLTNAIKEYGERGDAKLNFNEKSDDEISNVLKTFNKMIIERRQIEREIIEIIERERKRTGKELHDDLEQILNGIYNQILILREEINKFLIPDNLFILNYIEKIFKLLNQAINKSKSISNGLCPVSLKDGGIIESIKELIKSIQNVVKINFDFIYDDKIKIKDEIISLNLYYIVHEAILNSFMYNKANKITISMKEDKNNLILKIIDDGIIVRNGADNRLSIRVMNYNARLINADLEVINLINGTIVQCILKEYVII